MYIHPSWVNNECWYRPSGIYLFQVFLLNVVLAIFQQWLVPTALNSLEPFREMDYTRMLERLLLLAVCIICTWLSCDVYLSIWLSCDHSYPTTCSGCCSSTFSSILWWTQLEKYCDLQTESFTVTGGKICTLTLVCAHHLVVVVLHVYTSFLFPLWSVGILCLFSSSGRCGIFLFIAGQCGK